MKMIAGIATPKSAATSGNVILLGEDSSPATTSRFISIPTLKKNNTINKSLIICSGLCGRFIESKEGMFIPQKFS